MISRNVNGFTVWLTAGENWKYEMIKIEENTAEKRAEFQGWVWDQIKGEILALAAQSVKTKEVPEKLMKGEKKVVIAFDEMSTAKNTLHLLCRYHSTLKEFISGKLGCSVEILAGGTGADGTARSAGSNPQNYTVTRLTRIFGKENVPTLIETIQPKMVRDC